MNEYLFPKRLSRRDFLATAAMTVDAKGNLYVVEWVSFGRPRKFKHTPMTA